MLPRDAGRRCGVDGETAASRMLGLVRDCSSESLPRAVVVGPGCTRRSEAQNNGAVGHRGVQGKKKEKERGKRARGHRRSPELEVLPAAGGGAPSSNSGGLGAEWRGHLGATREGTTGFL